ncbi:hypothetical protein CsSME_00029820 [Camellia sinensis var. sinensis]
MTDGKAEIALTGEETNPTVTEDATLSLYLRSPYTIEAIEKYYNQCLPIYNAALEGDWEAANSIIKQHPTVVRARITEGWETVLHIATTGKHIRFVKELVAKMTRSDLEMTNRRGNTALCFAAVDGTVAIAKVMVDKNDKLPEICGGNGVKPLYMAALSGKRDMVKFLYERTKVGDWKECEKVKLLTTCVSTYLLDTALTLIEEYPRLTVAKDNNEETALHVLARKASIFAARNQPGIWSRFIKSAFTVPGGTNDKSDTPIFLNKRLFGVLSISGVALSFSTISTLMFSSILSSRYTERDFLRSLPLKLVLGMMTLFISMATMMVAFCTTFFSSDQHGLVWINVVFTLIVPVLVVYVLLKCPLLLDIIRSTHRTRTLFWPCKRLFDSHATCHV